MKPKKSEEQKKFVSRCVGDSSMVKEFPDQKQRAAVCYSQFKRKAKASESLDWEDSADESFIIY
jgi:rRNA maturation endonuclease Nob1